MSGGNKIPKGWVETTLGHIAMYINRGIAPKYSEEEGILVINQRCIRDNKVTFENARFNNLELRKVSFEKTIQSDDILICSTGTGTLGRVAQIKGDIKTSTVDSHVTIVRPDKNIHKPFLGHLLCSKEREIEYLAEGSTGQTELPRKRLEVFPLCIPENQKEQIAIANIITAFDDKIELLQAQNQTLEATAQTIFKEWFGKYQIGDELPEGWRVVELESFFDFLEGPGIRNWQYTDEGNRFINIRLIQNNDINVESANCVSIEEANGKYSHFQLKEKDFVLSTSGTLGRGAIVRKEHLPLLLNTSVIRFRPRDGYSYGYTYQFLQSRYFLHELESLASGSVQLNFGPMHLRQIVMVLPNEKTLRKYAERVNPLYDKMIQNLSQIQTLQQTRNTLLPKLMSGKLRVDEFKE